MNFKKCERCGCFHISEADVCQNCTPKDNQEVEKLKNYLQYNNNSSVDDISYNTGITAKNINRYIGSYLSDNTQIQDIFSQGGSV